jgi:hypothetical protein
MDSDAKDLDEARRAAAKQIRYKIISSVFCFLAILSIVTQVFGVLKVLNGLGILFSCFSIVFWISAESSYENRLKRARNRR